MFDMAAQKVKSRQSVHDILAVPAFYEDDTTAEPVGLTVRWHNKLVRPGAMDGGFDVTVIEGIDRLVFNEPQLIAAGLVLETHGQVTVPSWDAVFTLEAEEPMDGPVNRYWVVAYKSRKG